VRSLERRPLARRGRRTRHRPIRRFHLLVAARRRPHIRWAAAAALAATAGLLVHGAADAAGTARDRWGSTAAVAVATRDLAPGTLLDRGDVELRELPVAAVPAGAAVAEDGGGPPLGRVVVTPVYAGEPVDDRRLAPGGLSGVAALLPPGTRAVAIPGDPATVPPLTTGDAVDVLVAVAGPDGPLRPSVAATRAPVVDVGEQAVSLAIPESQVPAIATAASSGLVALALAGP
jgi:Flp pilus assembly protein CpaB